MEMVGNSNHHERSIFELADQLVELNKHAISIYEPIVEDIVDRSSKDVRYIEQTLDSLLGFANSHGGLRLFKSLCRYYWTIDPEATAIYVNAYREMWDSDGSLNGET